MMPRRCLAVRIVMALRQGGANRTQDRATPTEEMLCSYPVFPLSCIPPLSAKTEFQLISARLVQYFNFEHGYDRPLYLQDLKAWLPTH